jgi:hypothetical protein
MTPSQYKAARTKLGFTHEQAAACCRVHHVTARRWVRNGVTGPAEVILQLLDHEIITAADIEKLNPKKRNSKL